MPEEIKTKPEETISPPVEEKPAKPWFKPLLLSLLGLVLAGGLVFTGYQLGLKQAQPRKAERPTPTPAVVATPASDPTATWQTYTSEKYKYSIQFPVGWNYLEVPTQKYQTGEDQLWLSHAGFPPPQTGAMSDIKFIFTNTDPSQEWQPQYFDNFKSENYDLGGMSATKITGTNKQGPKVLVILAKIGDTHIQIFSNQGSTSLQYFDQILSTFKFTDEESRRERVYCEEPRPELCTMECIVNPLYICGSDGKSYCTECQACGNPRVEWYVTQNSPCEVE